MVINFRAKQNTVTDYRHTRRGAVWCEDARQQHRGLLPTVHITCHPANKMTFNPTKGGDLFQARRTAGGKRSLWEVLGLGKKSWEWSSRQEAGTITPGDTRVGLRWSHIPEEQLSHSPCTPFIKCCSFPEGVGFPPP